MTAARYRKRPVVIETIRFNGTNAEEIVEWATPHAEWLPMVGVITIHTLEGDMRVNSGDWVIKGVEGEFYPCAPSIFDATYEAAS